MPVQNRPKRRRLKAVPQRKREKAEQRQENHLAPKGWRPTDETFCLTPDDNAFADLGLYEGDTAIGYATADVRPEDLAAVLIGDETWLGKYRPAPGGYFTFEQDGDAERFKPGTAVLLGRVCHYERRGEIIRKFRPIR